jgi:uncharacterized membrane protein required for colicin V production
MIIEQLEPEIVKIGTNLISLFDERLGVVVYVSFSCSSLASHASLNSVARLSFMLVGGTRGSFCLL